MVTQKIVNLLNDSNNENSKFGTKKDMLLTVDQRRSSTQRWNQIFKSSLESSLCDYSDAYILITKNITVTGGNTGTSSI